MWGYHGTNINIRVLLVPGCIQWGLEVKTTHPPQTSQHFIKGLVKCRLLGGVEVYLCSFMWRWLNNIHFWLFFVGNFRGFIPQNQLSNDTTPPTNNKSTLKPPHHHPKKVLVGGFVIICVVTCVSYFYLYIFVCGGCVGCFMLYVCVVSLTSHLCNLCRHVSLCCFLLLYVFENQTQRNDTTTH